MSMIRLVNWSSGIGSLFLRTTAATPATAAQNRLDLTRSDSTDHPLSLAGVRSVTVGDATDRAFEIRGAKRAPFRLIPHKGTKRLYFPFGDCCHSITCVKVQYGRRPIILRGTGNSPRFTQLVIVLVVTPSFEAITFDPTNVSRWFDCSLFTLRLLGKFLGSFLFLFR